MRFRLFAVLPVAGAMLLGAAAPGATPAAEPAAVLSPDETAAILQKTATLRLAPDLSRLTAGERAAVEQLLQVGGIFQRLYEDARHPEAERERNRLLDEARSAGAASPPAESDAARLFRLFQGPIATTLDNRRVPFLPVAAEEPGKNVYPAGITAAEVESFLAAHPERRSSTIAPSCGARPQRRWRPISTP